MVPCIVILCWWNPTRCNSMQIFIYCWITVHVSGAHRAHHQGYIKLVAASGTDRTIWGASFFKRDQASGTDHTIWRASFFKRDQASGTDHTIWGASFFRRDQASGTDHTIWGASFFKRDQASGTDHTIWGASFFKRDQASGTDHTIWGASFFKRDRGSGTDYIILEASFLKCDHVVTFEEACFPDSMICTIGCNYSFVYSWWWARWTPETCTVILAVNKYLRTVASCWISST